MREAVYLYIVAVPVEKISKFHFSKDALKQLSPPGIHLEILNTQPLSEGAITRFRLWLGPLPIEWEARHQKVSLSHGFVDIQEKGPFQYWEHHHEWKAIAPNQTEMLERIIYQHASGFQGLLTRFLINPITLKFFFWHRRKVLSQLH